jgi:chemosensory pili system protein ChpA (sensor histidine kinase/response regulator)
VIEGAFLPLRRLDEFFDASPKPDGVGPVLILRVGPQGLALRVDEVIAQEEIVVKSLGELLEQHPLFAGMTIRGAGDLVLIVDVPSLLEIASGEAPSARPTFDRVRDDVMDEMPGDEPAPDELRILFVDDSLSVRKVAEKMLGSLGVAVTLAVDGLDAMAKLREGTFDLVFTDLEMPRMHGYELIREIRLLPALRGLPVVVVSSRSGEKHQQHARSLGATDYVTKPFTGEGLLAVLRRWVTERSDLLP